MAYPGFVENIASSLVREYLSRKECKNALEVMDSEMPRTEASIGNRSQLAKEVHIEKIMRKNKDATEPYRSMIEVIVKFLIERGSNSKDNSERVPEQRSSTDLSSPEKKSSPEKRSSQSSSRGKQKEKSEQKQQRVKSPKDKDTSPTEFTGLPQSDVSQGSLGREPTMVITMKDRPNVKPTDLQLAKDLQTSTSQKSASSDESRSKLISPSSSSSSSSSSLTRKMDDSGKKSSRPGSASKSRGLSGPITSSLDAGERRRGHKSSKTPALSLTATSKSATFEPEVSSSGFDLSPPKKTTSSSSRGLLKNFGFDLSPENTLGSMEAPGQASQGTSQGSGSEKTNGHPSSLSSSSTKPDRSSRHRRSFDDNSDVSRPGSRSGGSSRKGPSLDTPSVSSQKKEVSTLGDLEMGDVDELEDELGGIQLGSYTPSSKKPIDCRAITLQLAMQLKTLLFGQGTGCFNDEWRLQGLCFNELSDISYGIVQHKGGPCGLLASVQACMLQRLLFSEGSTPMTAANLKQLPEKTRIKCLVQAICDIVWRAGQKRNAVIALPAIKPHFPGGGRYKNDGLTEMINLNLFQSRDELADFVQGNIGTYTDSRGRGCILLLYSTLFSRTIDMVMEDMDNIENTLLGAHGYCTQEMVNLIVTGKAMSNVFNDTIELGSGRDITRLKGLSGRSDIGFLSLFEHYKSCQVGTYYKTPRFPIWVVCSESHFSVLFSLKKELIGDWRMERHFDLYYYDGLAKQQEEIRLTVDTTQTCPPADGDDLIPPLEHCIRTKWPEAVVNWNGSEPIL
ncbi:probable ubiquitin carboxyl-terminal hydrolase MINDY-4 isoform X1 [Strongylocentrotus purpuratus]|uniref:Ubiquitin carboxyl-terminal hydrolase MINDY n=1 Tax=Strongylocentrotus purpuratus TaxID=7668 RepID=A0A7M7T173_STRPU|nr:probable ubiquitin carboxyl-terminal hydrolase MINDY-4 isoform X1 [Strongylocentrotus purpuratus]